MAKRFQFRSVRAGRCRTVVLLLCLIACSTVIHSQELDQRDPNYIAFEVDRADLIVTGTFHVVWFYPWFDGWHYSGALDIEDVLYGDHPLHDPILFHWLEKYGFSLCRICERVSLLNRKSGVWLLTRMNGALELLGTGAMFCDAPLPSDTRKTVIQAIQQKRTKK